MKHIKLFESFSVNEEVETSILGSIAKKLYSMMKKRPIDQPMDKDGNPLKREDGTKIEYKEKIKMDYAIGASDYATKSKTINDKDDDGYIKFTQMSLGYRKMGNDQFIHLTGFAKKEEAEKVLSDLLSEYKDIKGEVSFVEGKRGWPDTWNLSVRLK